MRATVTARDLRKGLRNASVGDGVRNARYDVPCWGGEPVIEEIEIASMP